MKVIFPLTFLILIILAVFVYPKLPNRVEAKDQNNNGKIETWIKYKLWQYNYAEIDGNEDGKVDYWQYRNNADSAEREELDNNFDGRADFWVYYNKDNTPIRIERDNDFDGVKDSPKDLEKLTDRDFAPYYERNESYLDMFTYYFSGGKISKVESRLEGSDTVDQIDYYNDNGEISRSETLIDGKLQPIP